MQYSIKELFILFMIYSFLGWTWEVVWTLINDKKVVNRGFFIGPYCPIYGCGGILMILLLNKYISDKLTLFIMCILLFSILEYTTSFIMEKIFNARWWDYTKYKFNINGRICLETMIPFGIAGLISMYIVNPFFKRCLDSTPDVVLTLITIVLLIIFIIDVLLSSKIMVNIKGTIKNVKKDNTEEITQRVKEIILQKNYLKKRIIRAFPKFKIR